MAKATCQIQNGPIETDGELESIVADTEKETAWKCKLIILLRDTFTFTFTFSSSSPTNRSHGDPKRPRVEAMPANSCQRTSGSLLE